MIIAQIIDAIIAKLADTYDHPVYDELIEQKEMAVPCFVVYPVSVLDTAVLDPVHQWTVRMCVSYIPDGQQTNRECSEMMESLFWSLDMVDMPDGMPLQASEKTAEIMDQWLNVVIEYRNLRVEPSREPKDKMEELETHSIGVDE